MTLIPSCYIALSYLFAKAKIANKFLMSLLNPPPLKNSAYVTGLRRTKYVVFFLFCILVDRPMGRAIAPLPPLATLLTVTKRKAQRIRLIVIYSYSSRRETHFQAAPFWLLSQKKGRIIQLYEILAERGKGVVFTTTLLA